MYLEQIYLTGHKIGSQSFFKKFSTLLRELKVYKTLISVVSKARLEFFHIKATNKLM